MDPSTTAPSFAVASTRALRDAGLAGDTVQVTLEDRVLVLSGAGSGTLKLDLARVGRMRFGYFHGKYRRAFQVSIWQLGQEQPLVLEPVADDALGYGAAMRGFARALAAARGIGSIERGVGGAAAVMLLVFLMLPPAALVVVAVRFAPNMLVQAGLVVTAALLAVCGVWLYFKRQRPQPVASLEELEKQLPDPVSGA